PSLPPQARLAGADQRYPVAEHVDAPLHLVVGVGYLLEAVGRAEAGVYDAPHHQVVVGAGLFVVGPVRSLQPLLPDPVVAEVDDRAVPGRPGADHDHAPGLADEDARRDRRLPGMLEDDGRVAALAQHLPDLGPERPGSAGPLLLAAGVLPVRRHAPMRELPAVDVADGAELPAVLAPR